MSFSSPEFWVALLQIVGLNCVLSVDNAVALALAARRLPAHQQRHAFVWGGGAALATRITLTLVAVELLRLPYLKLIGAALLLWIGVQLLLSEPHASALSVGTKPGASLAWTIRTMVLADSAMSLDNVIAVAAKAKDSSVLLVAGLAISMPLVVFASALLLALMTRYPVIVRFGAGLIGWVAGELALADPAVNRWVDAHATWLQHATPAVGALGVVAVGSWLAARAATARP